MSQVHKGFRNEVSAMRSSGVSNTIESLHAYKLLSSVISQTAMSL